METDLTTQLTIEEKADLENLEGAIKRELGSFIVVGRALEEIRAKGLYRENFETFPAYCAEKWGLGRHQAYNLIRGSQVATNLLTAVNIPHPCEIQPVHERQVRPLAALGPDEQRNVWEEAVRSAPAGKVTYIKSGRVTWPSGSDFWLCMGHPCYPLAPLLIVASWALGRLSAPCPAPSCSWAGCRCRKIDFMP